MVTGPQTIYKSENPTAVTTFTLKEITEFTAPQHSHSSQHGIHCATTLALKEITEFTAKTAFSAP
jgi:hypothetical protein